MARDLRPIYTAPAEAAATERFDEFSHKCGAQYSAIIKLWQNAWSEFVPFLDYDVEIRRVICSTKRDSSKPSRGVLVVLVARCRRTLLPDRRSHLDLASLPG